VGLVFVALFGLGCAEQLPAAPLVPTVVSGAHDDSLICRGIQDHFLGLPGLGTAGAGKTRPLAGRWWIRGCAAQFAGSELRIELSGPGWYFVDQRSANFALKQQVPFSMGVQLNGEPRLSLDGLVAAFWLKPTGLPKVDLRFSQDLNVHPVSAWGVLLGLVPLLSVRDRVSESLSAAAVSALQDVLRDGATATYDIGSGQPDVALGRLQPGKTPEHAFADHIRWLVNDRVLLPPAGAHVVGPIEPGPTRLDTRIEQGSGLDYRVVCADDMAADFDSIAKGEVAKLPPSKLGIAGSFAGTGEHSATFQVDSCKFFVVVSTLGNATTMAALRVRA
jgi:hypothetical protein